MISATSEAAIKEKPSASNLSSFAFGSSRTRPILGPPQPIPLMKTRNKFFCPLGWAPFNFSTARFEMWIIFPPPLIKNNGSPLGANLLPRPYAFRSLVHRGKSSIILRYLPYPPMVYDHSTLPFYICQEKVLHTSRMLVHSQFFLAHDQGRSPPRFHKARAEGNLDQRPP